MDPHVRYERDRRRVPADRRFAECRFLRTVRSGADDDRLPATALWVYWGFAFDDARCDDGPLSRRSAEFNAVAGRVRRALEAPADRADGERFIPPLQDIAGRFRSLGTTVQFHRFAAAHRTWLSGGVCWQVGNYAHGHMPSLGEVPRHETAVLPAEARNMRRAARARRFLQTPRGAGGLRRHPAGSDSEPGPGPSIRHADRDAFSTHERLSIGEDLLAFVFRGFFVHRFFHADLHPGNVFVAPGEKAAPIDWGMVGRTDRRTGMLLMLILLSLAQNDGHGLAKAWVELGHATPWAKLGAFASDMAVLVPQIADAPLEELNFGLTLTRVLTCSTKRGIRTSPTVAVLGKAFANVEGSVRCLAPGLSLIEVFKAEMQHVMLSLAAETVSKEKVARTALEVMLGIGSVTDQMSGLMRGRHSTPPAEG